VQCSSVFVSGVAQHIYWIVVLSEQYDGVNYVGS
jgi:hypothetical protein